MSCTLPKNWSSVYMHCTPILRIGVPYHCMHVAKNVTVFTALSPWHNIKKCVGEGGGGLISFE